MLKKIYENKKDILFFVILFSIIFTTVMFKIIANYDEIWKYQFSKAITMGYIPYKDINMVVTPFYYLLTSILLFFDSSLFMYRIEIILLWIVTIFFLYKILKLKSKNYFYILAILSFCFYCYESSLYVFDYNIFLLTLVLLMTLLRLKIKNKNSWYFFLIGIVLALCDLTKHSVGLLIVIVSFIFYLIENRKQLKNILFLGIGIFIPNLIFLIYLLITNSLGDFFDYCLFGLDSFKNLFSLSPVFLDFLLISVLLIIKIVIKFFKTKNNDILYCLLMNICLFFLGYPIFNIEHLLPFLLYSFVFTIFFDKFNKESIVSIVIISLISFLFIGYNYVIYDYNKTYFKPSEVKDFKNFYTTELEDSLLSVSEYAKNTYNEENIVFLSEIAAYISIENNEYNGVFDLLLEGNLGIKELDDILDDDSIFVVEANYIYRNWQNLKDLMSYLEENYKIIDSFKYKNYNTYLFFKKP